MYICMYLCMYVCRYVCMHAHMHVGRYEYYEMRTDWYMCMYRYICEHAHFWDKQKGEDGWTPGWRLAVGRLPVVTPFPAARPSPALQDQSLHPPSPRCRRSTNNQWHWKLECVVVSLFFKVQFFLRKRHFWCVHWTIAIDKHRLLNTPVQTLEVGWFYVTVGGGFNCRGTLCHGTTNRL